MHRAIYNHTLVNNWTIQGYNTILYPSASAPGAGELITQCAIIAPDSSFTLTAPGPGFFLGKLSIAFWAQYATTADDLQLTLAASDRTLPQVPFMHPTCAMLIVHVDSHGSGMQLPNITAQTNGAKAVAGTWVHVMSCMMPFNHDKCR